MAIARVPISIGIGSKDFYPFLDYINYLDSISTLANREVWAKNENGIVTNIHSKTDHTPRNKLNLFDALYILKILESAWLNELALRHSLDQDKGKFAHWDIIKFYYIIYNCVSIIARIAESNVKSGQHYGKIRIYNKAMINNKAVSKMIITPFQVVYGNHVPFLEPAKITSWSYGQKTHCASLKKCLEETHKKANREIVSVVDFFLSLRILANYSGTHIMKHMYGTRVKAKLLNSIERISKYFIIMTELMVIRYTNIDPVKKCYNDFKQALDVNLKVDSTPINNRFLMYDIIFGLQKTLKGQQISNKQ